MAGLGDLVQKAFYLGVGMASYAGEKAGKTIGDLRLQAQKIADEMVARGEMTAEDARSMVDDMVNRAQKAGDVTVDVKAKETTDEPRSIEIEDEDGASPSSREADELQRQIADLQSELQRLKRGSP